MAMKEEMLDMDRFPVTMDDLSALFGGDIYLPINSHQDDDATRDADTFGAPKNETVQFIPISLPLGPPQRTNCEGELNFTVCISSNKSHKNRLVYSHKLNRIYVNMEQSFSVQFKWHNDFLGVKYVRATPVFADESQWQQRVMRCIQHQHVNTVTNDDPSLVHHVLRSDRPSGTSGVYYTGDSNTEDSWLSVLVAFPPAESYHHAYRFVCKNSCTSGINRRSTELMFTLEDQFGKVLGRQSAGIRVCSCPDRDMKKDEEDFRGKGGLKRKIKEPLPKNKRPITVPSDDEMVYTLPPGLQLIGSRTVNSVLTVIEDMTELVAKADPTKREKCTAIIAQWKSAFQDIKNKPESQ